MARVAPDVTAIHLGRSLPTASSNQPGRQAWKPARTLARPRRPYSVLLPVGFAVPPTLPPARCALTAPFHPCPSPPGLRRAVCFLWHCPWGRPRRTLSGTVFPRSPDFPPHEGHPTCGGRPADWRNRHMGWRPPGSSVTRMTSGGHPSRDRRTCDRSGLLRAEARDDGTHLGAIGAVRAVHALGIMTALVAHHGGAGVAAGHLVGLGEILHGIAQVGVRIVETGRRTAVAEAAGGLVVSNTKIFCC
jgi:hypothetical protein